MSEQNSPQQPQPKIDSYVSPGAYATGLAIVHSQEEIMLDFINAIAAPPKVVSRIIVSPLQLKRIVQAIKENTRLYQETFGPIPSAAAKTPSKNENAGDLYSKIDVTHEILGGYFSNAMSVRYTKDIFILDFMSKFPPVAKIVSRVLISPAQILSMTGAMDDNINQYEKRFGKIQEVKTTDQSMGFSLN